MRLSHASYNEVERLTHFCTTKRIVPEILLRPYTLLYGCGSKFLQASQLAAFKHGILRLNDLNFNLR